MNPHLLCFLKYPEPGCVKTRLAAAIGEEAACRAYRRLVERQFVQIPADWSVEVRCDGASEASFQRWLGIDFLYRAQEGAGLGERLLAAFETALAEGRRPALAIGGDCPWLDTTLLERAATQLEEHDLVFGPARDGGYYLVGMHRCQPALFEGISWSSEQVLAQSLARAEACGLSVGLLPELEDVDTLAEWERACADFPELS